MDPANPFRAEFQILERRMHGHPLAYLDSAATTQKPRAVIAALGDFYTRHNANVHRGVYTLSEEASALYEQARQAVAGLLNARSRHSIVFTRGATEALNLAAFGWARPRLRPGDEILATVLEHHSNLVPWQMVARETGARLVLAGITPEHTLDVEDFTRLLSARTRVVAVTHTSNVLGCRPPLAELIGRAHEAGARVVVDAAQGIGHAPVDVQALDCDFLAFSGHKLYGPMGIGALYGKPELLEEIAPVQGGGGMIEWVEEQAAAWAPVPARLEAGTPNVADAHGLAAALEYFLPRRAEALGMEERLTGYALERLLGVPGLTVYGPRDLGNRAGVLSFTLEGAHPHDVAEVLDTRGVAVRAGHHCCQPLMRRLGIAATVRASLGMYSTAGDVDQLVDGLAHVRAALLP